MQVPISMDRGLHRVPRLCTIKQSVLVFLPQDEGDLGWLLVLMAGHAMQFGRIGTCACDQLPRDLAMTVARRRVPLLHG